MISQTYSTSTEIKSSAMYGGLMKSDLAGPGYVHNNQTDVFLQNPGVFIRVKVNLNDILGHRKSDPLTCTQTFKCLV